MTFAGSNARSLLIFAVLLVLALIADPAAAQVGAQQQVLTLARGSSELVVLPNDIARISIGDPEVADAVAVSPREVLVNAGNLGTTTLIVWDVNENRRFYTVEVTPNVAALERQLAALFPGENINVIASGGALILSGTVSNAGIARRAVEIATATGATVLDNLITPAAQQILLQVRFAEVSRTAATQIASALSGRNLDELEEVTDWTVETLSDGLVRLFLLGNGAEFNAVIQALKSNGTFRSLAEPNLVALEGQEASFLAGGEFPFPVPQGGTTNAVTIQFREFGVRLRFTPRITVGGDILLTVAPEVSSLDFANGVRFSGFEIPSLLTRRAETSVVLREGQTFAIAGLMDQSILDNTDRIPFLGSIPILGAFFRNRDARQNQTELLVLVTPRLVQPSDTPPPLPTGEPDSWDWDRRLRGQQGGPVVRPLPPGR